MGGATAAAMAASVAGATLAVDAAALEIMLARSAGDEPVGEAEAKGWGRKGGSGARTTVSACCAVEGPKPVIWPRTPKPATVGVTMLSYWTPKMAAGAAAGRRSVCVGDGSGWSEAVMAGWAIASGPGAKLAAATAACGC